MGRDFMIGIWAYIREYEGLYKISNFGVILRTEGVCKGRRYKGYKNKKRLFMF